MKVKRKSGRVIFNHHYENILVIFIKIPMKKHLIALSALTVLSTTAAMAQQVEDPWMVRLRVVHLDSANKDSTGLGLSINNKTLPELDISYFFTPNVAAELILAVPQKHSLSSSVVGGKIGTLKHLPPTLTLQYHFNPEGVKPYLGLGVNFTRFSGVRLTVPGADIKRSSFGLSLQAGVDIPLKKNLYLNFDVKKIFIETDVKLSGSKVGTFKVDPVVLGIGLGWRF